MDIYTTDRHLQSSDDFPQSISPFPDPASLLYSNPTAVVHSSNIIVSNPNHLPPPPPQKLRPIRFNSRSPASYPSEIRSLEKCAFTSPEVEFVSNQFPVVNEDANDFFDSASKVDSIELTNNSLGGNVGDVVGNGYLLGANKGKVKSDTGAPADDLSPIYGGRLFEDESSSSWGRGGDDCIANTEEEPMNRKRKRRRKRKLEQFLENLVMKVMEKQEEMHRQLIEMIEKREREKLLREEAWKQQEIERIKRDEELRAQETSRSLALIALIQNLYGHEIHIPQREENQCMEEEEDDDGGESGIQKERKYEPKSKRWPRAEVQALITVRTALEHKFRATGSKGSIWEEISVGIRKMGYARSAKKCKEKWENINKYFKRATESGKKHGSNGRCPYFHELDILYRNGSMSPGNALDNTNNEAIPKDEVKGKYQGQEEVKVEGS